MTGSIARSTWIAIAIAAAVVFGVVAVVAAIWGEIDDSGMSAGGWIAMLLGVLATLGLGTGLMALVFISNRRGYDDPGGPQS